MKHSINVYYATRQHKEIITELINPAVANFLWFICAKNYESGLAMDTFIAIINRLAACFFAHPVQVHLQQTIISYAQVILISER